MIRNIFSIVLSFPKTMSSNPNFKSKFRQTNENKPEKQTTSTNKTKKSLPTVVYDRNHKPIVLCSDQCSL